MNLSVFPVYSTNIFPLANDSKAGGQLMTEYNLTSRESVGTWEQVNYRIGPSFCHSKTDFKVTQQTDGAGTIISNTTLELSSGRAVINGHYIESLENVLIDLLDLNQKAKLEGTQALKGALTIGLRAMYSTEATMANAMMKDNKDEIYEGIQVVVLPSEQFKLPEDVPSNPDKVTAHIKLATFNFTNGAINTVVDNFPQRIQNTSAERIANVDKLVSDLYLTKNGLNPKKLYVFSGKGKDENNKDTWCEAQDSLVVWDRNPELTTEKSDLKQAQFGTSTKGYTQLYLPHKQVDGMTTTDGRAQYFKDRVVNLPLANYSAGTPGTVDKEYTNHIKQVAKQIQNIYRMPGGKQVGFVNDLTNPNIGEDPLYSLPVINTAWNIGDYVVVKYDGTLESTTIEGITAPATMYVVLPGLITKFKFLTKVSDSDVVPKSLTGIRLGNETGKFGDEINTTDWDVYSNYFVYKDMRGVPNVDYFVITIPTDEDNDKKYDKYYFTVSEAGDHEYSEPVWLTGQMTLATDSTIGGFYNVTDSNLDQGYVYLDESGHLVLLDYSLLRSGVLAYQLGSDYDSGSGLTAQEVQNGLDDYVNDRVAFGNADHIANAANPRIINVTINLTDEDTDTVITLKDIDSRFNTSVYLHITGTATSKCVINLLDCQKIRIDSNIGGKPTINLKRCCLYYDSNIIEYLNEIEGMSLWYEKFNEDDANLLVDNMTVRECDAPIIPDDLDYWNESTPNDNHFMFALQSITFGPDGNIIGCGLYVKNETSANISEGQFVIASEFTLPQGAGLTYPRNRLVKQIKVSGSFVNAYAIDSPTGLMVLDTNFTALTEAYNSYDTSKTCKGNVAFLVNARAVSNVTGLEIGQTVDGWESNAFHYFSGVVI